MAARHDFSDAINPQDRLTVEAYPTSDMDVNRTPCIRLGIKMLMEHGGSDTLYFYLSPNDFGEFTAAMWECSPSGKPNADQLVMFQEPCSDYDPH